MVNILLIVAFLFFAFIAPVRTTATFVGFVLLVSLVVKISAQAIGNVSVSLAQSFRAVACSLFFLIVAIFTLGSFSVGTGIHQFTGMAAIAALGGLFMAYSLGFMVGLGTALGASCGIAFISTLVSAAYLALV